MHLRILSRAARLALAVAVAVMMIGVTIPIASGAPTTYYVDIVNGSDAANGTSEATAWKTLDRAFEGPGTVPIAGDTVMVLPGTYSEANGEEYPITFIPGVTLASKMGPDTTIIDGTDTVSTDFFQLNGVVAGTTIRGFTFEENINNSCIYVAPSLAADLDGWPLIEGNVFRDNDEPCVYLESTGAGVLGAEVMGNEFYDNGDIAGNYADDGSCVYANSGSAPVVEDNYFHDNYADDATVYTYGDSSARIAYNTFENNGAATNGAAIWVDNTTGKTSIVGNTFEGNVAGDGGGAVATDWSDDVVIHSNYFTLNEAVQDGGAIATENSTVTISANMIFDNIANDDGGGISARDSHHTIVNNQIFANTCDGGGGAVDSLNSDVDFFNNTVYGNLSTAISGGWNGIYHTGTGTFTISNSILWGHLDEDAENTTIRYSCTEADDAALGGLGNILGSGVIHTDPMFYDADNDDLRLEIGSPCIDKGANGDAPATDIEGTARPADGDGDGTATVDMGAWERSALAVGRVWGADRYATAAQIAKDTFSSASIAVIASGQNFPDALSASGLCGAHEAPLLLTRTASLPAVTSDTLSDLGVSSVIVVGGTGAVSQDVEDALAVDYDVTRIAGLDRYATSALVAEEVATVSGENFSYRAFIARGDAFPDALAVSPYAYSDISPILLVRPALLPQVTKTVLEDLDIEQAFVCGETGAVSSGVKAAVDAVIRGNTGNVTYSSDRWGGIDRYATAVEVANGAADEEFGDFEYVGIATGSNFPDALAGGVGAGVNRGVVLLTRTDALPKVTADELATRGSRVLRCDIFGGDGAVTPAVKTAVLDALGW